MTAAQLEALQEGVRPVTAPAPARRAFLVTAGIMLLALVITLVAIRVRRADLAGSSPF